MENDQESGVKQDSVENSLKPTHRLMKSIKTRPSLTTRKELMKHYKSVQTKINYRKESIVSRDECSKKPIKRRKRSQISCHELCRICYF